MSSEPQPYFNPDDPEDPGPLEVAIPALRAQMEAAIAERFPPPPPLREVPDIDPEADELDAYLRSEAFRQSFAHGIGGKPLDERGRSNQEAWIEARRTFEAMSTASLRRYVVKGVARTHRETATAILRERIERRDTRLKIAGAVALSLGGLGALAQAIVQLFT